MPRKLIDLTGQRFGRLLVLEYRRAGGGGAAYWRCLCDCGTEKLVTGGSLRRNNTRSCGCLKSDVLTARNFKHGLMTRTGRTRTYNSWQQMIARTTNPDHPRWADWGGRGITVCDRWRDYPSFLADMGEKPPGLTLDRIDNNGDYEPGNCRWATHAQQAINKTGFKLTPAMMAEIQRLYATGLTMSAVAERVGVDRHTVSKALWNQRED